MPKKPRSTTDPFGQKLLQVLRDKERADDLAFLAAAFDVKVQSTYDWINHGRMAKDRFKRLVEWSGHSLHWWFDIPDLKPEQAPLRVHEPVRIYSRPAWPFEGVSEAEICALSRDDRLRLEGALALTGAQFGLRVGNVKAA